MDEYLTDKEQVERLKKWWSDNYKSILAGVIIAAAIIFGWRWWQHRVEVRSMTASMMYNRMGEMLAANDFSPAVQIGHDLMKNYIDTPYATQAALALAQNDVSSNKPDDAAQMLVWVLKNSKDEGLKLLARLRLARVKLMVGDPQAALHELDGVQPGGFAALYAELRGDAYARLGDNGKARAAYQQALSLWTPEMQGKSMLQMKLQSLSPAPGAAKAPAPSDQPKAGKP
ncbi:MAG: tetratricopeptide repeat protein [Gammaproteobacteria bacterium]|nr:tetratricopeptide repeat protein [Gammaproteobacteria bacterium]MDE2345632.1 tetratricopeptide repeat protein [Gammaproteobacteria bacterium]